MDHMHILISDPYPNKIISKRGKWCPKSAKHKLKPKLMV